MLKMRETKRSGENLCNYKSNLDYCVISVLLCPVIVLVSAAPIHFAPCVLGVCGCCGALRPRYKRLVDNIFPEDPEVRSDKMKALSLKREWFTRLLVVISHQ